MGGLRKAMPVTFVLMVVMVITTSGLPPFAAFFSKGLVISSVTDVNLVQAILLYATAAITFAYVIRMLSLVFMGKESEHLLKQHPHEAPKIMLIPAAILAGLCIIWGLSMTTVANFMHLNALGLSLLGSFTDIETPIFLALLVPTGLLVYWSYYKNSNIRTVASGSNPITTLLKHAYFFDDFYRLIVKGITKFSDGVKYVEDSANQTMTGFAVGVVVAASKLKKVPSTTVQNYIAAAVVGFVLIIVLIILTLGIGV